jgi:DNA mismatch repair protein MSH5
MRQSVEEDLDQIIAAIDMKDGGTVGCSYYSAQEKRLYVLGDIQHSNSEVIETRVSCMIVSYSLLLADLFLVILQIKPTVLLTSTRIDHSSISGQPSERENG